MWCAKHLMRGRVDWLLSVDTARPWEIGWYTRGAVFQQHFRTNLGYNGKVTWEALRSWSGLLGHSGGEEFQLQSSDKWKNRIPRVDALIFQPVRHMRPSVVAGPQHHKPVLNYSPHIAARWAEHYNWAGSPLPNFISLSLVVSPQIQQHDIMLSSLSLWVFSGKQGHQHISRSTFLNVIRKVDSNDKNNFSKRIVLEI